MYNEVPTTALTSALFRTACNIISCQKSTDSHPTKSKDQNLAASFSQFQEVLPSGFVWPHREGLRQALIYSSDMFMVNVKVDVVKHFEERIRHWLVVRMKTVITQDDITERHLCTIANRIVVNIVWKEKKEGAIALAAGRAWPKPPQYTKPTSLTSLLGEVIEKLPALHSQTQEKIWQLFEDTLLKKIGGALPLCPTNYGRAAENDK